jgi:hypothetical protein
VSAAADRLARIAAELRELRRRLEHETDAEAATALVERVGELADEAAEELERRAD